MAEARVRGEGALGVRVVSVYLLASGKVLRRAEAGAG